MGMTRNVCAQKTHENFECQEGSPGNYSSDDTRWVSVSVRLGPGATNSYGAGWNPGGNRFGRSPGQVLSKAGVVGASIRRLRHNPTAGEWVRLTARNGEKDVYSSAKSHLHCRPGVCGTLITSQPVSAAPLGVPEDGGT